MNTIFVKVITVLLCLFIIITVGSQIYMAVNDKYETETAVSYSSATMESFYGVFVRDETPIKYSGGGAVSYSVPDGSKVANDSVVACVYKSEDPIVINSRIEALKDEIELLESAQNPGTTEAASPGFISPLIDEQYQLIATKLAKGDAATVSANCDQFLLLSSIYQIAIGEAENFDSRIDELYRQLNELESRQQNPTREITVDNPGYFVSYTDGYEDSLNFENISELTADDIKKIIFDENSGGKGTSKNTIGKLIDGYDWKMVGIIDNSNHTYTAGDSVELKFASTSDSVTAVIELITDTDDPNESIVQLDCDQMTFDLVRRRVEHVEMVLHDYEGIRVPRSALRFDKNNEKGVYVLLGQRVMFKKLDVIFECDDYLLSRITSDSSYVSIYDEIILSGVNTTEYLSNTDDDEDIETEPEEEEIPVYSETEMPSETEASEEEQEDTETESGETTEETASEETSETLE